MGQIISGLCECGCGQRTKFPRNTDRKHGWIKGQPLRFIKGHNHIGKIVSRETKEKMSLAAIKHGHSRTINGKDGSREYHSWLGLKQRCTNPKAKTYPDYGGRGITICNRWLGENGFTNFLDDMGKCPEGLVLDRKDNNGNYEPGNCGWIDLKSQQANRRHVTNAQYNKLEKSFLFVLICLELAMRKGGENVPNYPQ